jgi:hypothetical protein
MITHDPGGAADPPPPPGPAPPPPPPVAPRRHAACLPASVCSSSPVSISAPVSASAVAATEPTTISSIGPVAAASASCGAEWSGGPPSFSASASTPGPVVAPASDRAGALRPHLCLRTHHVSLPRHSSPVRASPSCWCWACGRGASRRCRRVGRVIGYHLGGCGRVPGCRPPAARRFRPSRGSRAVGPPPWCGPGPRRGGRLPSSPTEVSSQPPTYCSRRFGAAAIWGGRAGTPATTPAAATSTTSTTTASTTSTTSTTTTPNTSHHHLRRLHHHLLRHHVGPSTTSSSPQSAATAARRRAGATSATSSSLRRFATGYLSRGPLVALSRPGRWCGGCADG